MRRMGGLGITVKKLSRSEGNFVEKRRIYIRKLRNSQSAALDHVMFVMAKKKRCDELAAAQWIAGGFEKQFLFFVILILILIAAAANEK